MYGRSRIRRKPMRFYGNGVVWDAENDKRLCKFSRAARGEKGVFETDDKRAQAILIERGYAFDPEPISGKVESPKQVAPSVSEPPKQDNQPGAEPVTAEMNAKALRMLGKELGLSFPANMKKTEMAKAINEAKK
jgi:hypothetical protein